MVCVSGSGSALFEIQKKPSDLFLHKGLSKHFLPELVWGILSLRSIFIDLIWRIPHFADKAVWMWKPFPTLSWIVKEVTATIGTN